MFILASLCVTCIFKFKSVSFLKYTVINASIVSLYIFIPVVFKLWKYKKLTEYLHHFNT